MSIAGDPAAPANPDHLLILAGRGAYPLELAVSARAQGVERLTAIAFRGETDPRLARRVDALAWIHVGALSALLNEARRSGARAAVMAGQIRPRNLFRVRMDRAMWTLLSRLKERNAETIFGAVGAELRTVGVDLLPAHRFMERCLPAPGALGRRAPDEREARDIELGRRVARAVSALDIGQTVVVKEGTILAVEAFEGTDAAILRAGRVGGPGAVVVKTAKPDHDMRFDIPVVGRHTFRSLRRARISALAVEAGRTIVLERERLAAEADRMNLAFIAFPGEAP